MADRLAFCGTANLKPGDRIRHRRHSELTGTIKAYEWNKPGVLSAIPYNVAWDDSGRAHELLGMFWIYASDHGVELLDGGPECVCPDADSRRGDCPVHGARGPAAEDRRG